MTAKKESKKESAKKKSPQKKKDLCFVIMPFGGWFDDYYESIYRPAIEASGLAVKRTDDLYRPGTIVNDIWSLTKEAKILLADLTGKNPNVFYELGLAHALAKPVILVTDSMGDVPFDLRSLRVLEYDKNMPTWGDSLQTDITKAVKELLASPLEAVLPTFLSVKPAKEDREVSEHDKAILEIRQELESVKMQMRQSFGHYRDDEISGPKEAERLIRRYLRMKMPRPMIIDRMISKGVPEEWVHRILDRASPQMSLFGED